MRFVVLRIGNSDAVYLSLQGTFNPSSDLPKQPFVLFCFVSLSYHTTHTTTAERRAEKQCQRRGASSGQKTKRGIEGEDLAAAGIERFFSLNSPREENNV